MPGSAIGKRRIWAIPDRVYCVFDEDGRASYRTAVAQLAAATPKGTFFAVTSAPCFEYWLLLHFLYTTHPYTHLPDNSAGNQVLAQLQCYMPDYAKGQRQVFGALLAQLEFAKENAKRALKAAQANHTDNPSTRVHEMIEFLQQIKTGR